MEVMVELNGSRVAASGSQHVEFGMIPLEAIDVLHNGGFAASDRQAGMTPRAIRVARGGKPNGSPVVSVAKSTRGSERLISVMQRAVMAREALLVDDFFVGKTQVGQVAGGALLRENCVRGG
jgi:hypothetical protein